MIAKISRDMRLRANVPENTDTARSSLHNSLPQVLWRRRWVLAITTLAVLLIASLYLFVATPIFTASSSIYIEQTNAKILTDSQGFMTKSDSFLYTQAEIIKSAPILVSALDKVDYHRMKTFAKVDNPVAWLQLSKDFDVEVGKKDDVVSVSLDSPYPQEAAEVVNSIMDAYMTSQGVRKKSTAAEMLKVLQREKDNRYAELSDKIKALLKYKSENGALSFQDDKGNIILERLAKLSDTLTALELEKNQLQSQYDTARSILNDPTKIQAYVEDIQTKNNAGDKEYDETRSEVLRYRTMLFSLGAIHGENSQVVQTVRLNLQGLEKALADKEMMMARERATQLEQELKAAKESEDQCRASFQAQQKEALDLNSKAAEYSRLQEEVTRTEKQCGDLDNRIKEVTVNSEDSGTLNIQVLEAARSEDKPTKPRRAMTMAAALLIGLILGSGLSLVWDWADQRIISSDEVADALGISVLGIVPYMDHVKTMFSRGQQMHLEPSSIVSEAYRTIRTAVHFAGDESLKTILVTSPAPGDGKSTTASNLAIALAQAGNRTLLLDADLRRPTQHEIFEMKPEHGLSSVIEGKKKLRDVIEATPIQRLDVLPCGPVPSNPSEIVAGSRFAQVLRALTEGYDRVVIDSPPIIAVTDARILSALVDATILVLRTNRSTRKGSRAALLALYSSGASVIGSVVNAMQQQANAYGYYGHYGSTTTYASRLPEDTGLPQIDPASTALGQLPADALLLTDVTSEALSNDAVSLS